MIGRTRRELIDFLCLVFSISLTPAPRYRSAEEVAATLGTDVELVHVVDASGLLRSEPSRPGRAYDADDVRVMAIVAAMLDLGATVDDVRAYGDRLAAPCVGCAAASCPTRCDAMDVLRQMLEVMAARARRNARRRHVPHIARAIDSIDALSDLV